ncbi:5-oxoprolinase subunit PxpB [Robertkochia aurantiaca]|uniref:5-oxoprolinase subunit PxpB n=1 Tax=Robertkochia aurantiaca TaxID=2873700 RepID=UPI001CCA90C5|nr:5-oxoprolinase subunit PxpB [Robertkochia sp. 3YJGBD-33]
MDKFKLEYKSFGDHALLIQWPRLVDESILTDIISFNELIKQQLDVQETVPAYNSLLLIFDTETVLAKMIKEVNNLYKGHYKSDPVERKRWQIPVCYDTEFGIDLEDFAFQKKLSVEDVIKLHTEPVYTIYAIGFLPGFMYLGGLNKTLHHPRRKEPRLKIPRGSVGIGGEQTGVYPQESPGGWNIIGNSPIRIFNPENQPPCGVNVGDQVQFYSIDKPTHELFTIQVESGIFQLKTLELND